MLGLALPAVEKGFFICIGTSEMEQAEMIE